MNAAVVILPNCNPPRFPSTIFSTASTETKFRKSNLFLKQEIADGASDLSRRNLLPSSLWGIRSDGNRRDRLPGRNSATSKPGKEDSNQYSFETSDNESSNSSNQEEIIALFRRIQSSISKSGSPITQNRRPENSKQHQSAASVLDGMLQSRKQLEEGKSSVSPSKFVKRPPIRMTSTAIEEVVEVTSVDSSAVDNEELQKVEDMKVSDLKELAKSKGLKGYSKLRKGELVDLLKGL